MHLLGSKDLKSFLPNTLPQPWMPPHVEQTYYKSWMSEWAHNFWIDCLFKTPNLVLPLKGSNQLCGSLIKPLVNSPSQLKSRAESQTRRAQARKLLIDPQLMSDICSEWTSTVSVSQQVAGIKSPDETSKGPKRLQTHDWLLLLSLSCSQQYLLWMYVLYYPILHYVKCLNHYRSHVYAKCCPWLKWGSVLQSSSAYT